MPTQANTIPAHADTSPDMPAHACTTLVPPSQKRKPLCDIYLYRWIRPSFPFRGGRQAGLDEYRQGIEVQRSPVRASRETYGQVAAGSGDRAELGEVGRPAPNFVAALRSANPAGKIQPATIDNPGKDPCRKQDQD